MDAAWSLITDDSDVTGWFFSADIAQSFDVLSTPAEQQLLQHVQPCPR